MEQAPGPQPTVDPASERGETSAHAAGYPAPRPRVRYSRTMDRARTVATFIAGVLVGGSAVYFSPPTSGTAAGSPMGQSGPMLPPLPEGGVAPGGQPGAMPPTPGTPGTPGTPAADGTLPTQMGAVPMPDPSLPSPDAAEGPPPDAIPAAPAGTPQQSGSRLEKHLKIATELWTSQAAIAKASPKDAIKALAPDIEVHASNVPPITEHMPPMQEVAGYLAASRVLLDRMSAAGMDVADLSLQVDMMMRPPRGKIPGGPKQEGAP